VARSAVFSVVLFIVWAVVGGETKQTDVAFFFYAPKNGELKNSLVCVIIGFQRVVTLSFFSE
jgi:hypothetical protein